MPYLNLPEKPPNRAFEGVGFLSDSIFYAYISMPVLTELFKWSKIFQTKFQLEVIQIVPGILFLQPETLPQKP